MMTPERLTELEQLAHAAQRYGNALAEACAEIQSLNQTLTVLTLQQEIRVVCPQCSSESLTDVTALDDPRAHWICNTCGADFYQSEKHSELTHGDDSGSGS